MNVYASEYLHVVPMTIVIIMKDFNKLLFQKVNYFANLCAWKLVTLFRSELDIKLHSYINRP